ncbi:MULTISPECIES: hypothetical protein [Pseudomonas]|uniref:Uncharacterized protein n=1 Tax=Pseudomonas fluorescens TaxID=294 RepID=A0A165YTS3_PSEFL|nr:MULTISPECIES: hypothetical protein [Pseudomonas]AMZ69910.1 hypothetical protein TK06_01925 [Pseudomonas fluorescens]
MTDINDVVKATPGLFLDFSSGPGRQIYKARGFEIDNLIYDGIPSGYNGINVGAHLERPLSTQSSALATILMVYRKPQMAPPAYLCARETIT